MPSTEMSKETKMNLSQFNLQDILEPLAKASAGNTRNQYLNVSRFIENQSSRARRDSNMSLFSNFSNNGSAAQNKNKKTGKVDLPNLWTDFGDLSSGRRRLGNLNVTNPTGYDLTAK